jgi:ribosomal-protein-alanine N-acetyltransferase
MRNPESISPGESTAVTGVTQVPYLVAPVSHIWLPRLVEIDSSWNPRHWSTQLFEGELANAAARALGIFFGKDLIGYGIAHVVCDEAHIVSFGIAPKRRGKGAGEYLLRELLRTLEGEGVTVVTLEVRRSNSAAQALYAKLGFEVVALRERYYSSNNEDALSMRVELARVGGREICTER